MIKDIYLKTLLAFCMLTGCTGMLTQNICAQQVQQLLNANTAPHFLPEATSGQSAFRQAATGSKPGNSQDYLFQNGAWAHQENSVYTYNSIGQLTSRTKTFPASGLNKSREVYTYDAHQNQIEKVNQNWVSGAWVTGSGLKTIYTYNASGKPTEIINQSLANNVWTNMNRITNAYNAAGQLTEDIWHNWNNNSWVPGVKNQYVYSGGNLTTLINQNYINNTWTDIYQRINIVWHNQALQQYASYTTQTKPTGTWADAGRTSYTHDPNGGFIAFYETYNNGNWENSILESEIKDSKKNLTNVKIEVWNGTGWVIYGAEQHLLTYNTSDDLTEHITQIFNQNLSTYENYSREVYSNFQQFVTGTGKDLALLQASVYPNPIQNNLNIQLPETKFQTVTATLTDVTGRKVLSQTLNSERPTHQINIEKLPAGIYLLQLQSENSFRTIKVIKK